MVLQRPGQTDIPPPGNVSTSTGKMTPQDVASQRFSVALEVLCRKDLIHSRSTLHSYLLAHLPHYFTEGVTEALGNSLLKVRHYTVRDTSNSHSSHSQYTPEILIL